MSVFRTERIDLASGLAAPEVTPEGFMRLSGRFCRVGVQIYSNADGSVRREFRPADEVEKSLPLFAQLPVTNDHPGSLLKTHNAADHAVGACGPATLVDGYGQGSIVLWEKGAIEAVRSGKAQLSAGYTTQLIEEPGEYNGEKYDAVQRSIVPNHLAIVDAARCGPGCSLKIDCACPACAKGETTMSTEQEITAPATDNAPAKGPVLTQTEHETAAKGYAAVREKLAKFLDELDAVVSAAGWERPGHPDTTGLGARSAPMKADEQKRIDELGAEIEKLKAAAPKLDEVIKSAVREAIDKRKPRAIDIMRAAVMDPLYRFDAAALDAEGVRRELIEDGGDGREFYRLRNLAIFRAPGRYDGDASQDPVDHIAEILADEERAIADARGLMERRNRAAFVKRGVEQPITPAGLK